MVSPNGYSNLLLLLFLASPLALRAESKATLRIEADLHTHAEWRVNAQLNFDSSGRLVVLYRDKFKPNPKGNWHLVRLMPPFLDGTGREEITFSIPQEPVDPDSARRWDDFSFVLLLSPDGSRGYAIFEGTVVTAKSDHLRREPCEMSVSKLLHRLFHSTSAHFDCSLPLTLLNTETVRLTD